MNRKEFIKTTGRFLILGGIATSAGYLLVNKKVTATCSVSPTCKFCGKISNCENPNVKIARSKNEVEETTPQELNILNSDRFSGNLQSE